MSITTFIIFWLLSGVLFVLVSIKLGAVRMKHLSTYNQIWVLTFVTFMGPLSWIWWFIGSIVSFVNLKKKS